MGTELLVNSNPAILADVTNKAEHELIESHLYLGPKFLPNDQTLTYEKFVTVTHLFEGPLFNLAWEECKTRPDWVDDFKLYWYGAPPIPFPASVWVFDPLHPPGPEMWQLPKFEFNLPDIAGMISRVLADLADGLVTLLFSLVPTNLRIPGLDWALGMLAKFGADVLGILQGILDLGSAVFELLLELADTLASLGLAGLMGLTGILYDKLKFLIDPLRKLLAGLESGAEVLFQQFVDLCSLMASWGAKLITLVTAFVTGLLELPFKMLQVKLDLLFAQLLQTLGIDLASLGLSWLLDKLMWLAKIGLSPFSFLGEIVGMLTQGAGWLLEQVTDLIEALAELGLAGVIAAGGGLYLAWKWLLDALAAGAQAIEGGIQAAEMFVLGLLASIQAGFDAFVNTCKKILDGWKAQLLELLPVVPRSGTIQQIPPAVVTLFPSAPAGPYTPGLVVPLVVWPDWLIPQGVVGIPLQLPPGLQTGLSTAPPGVIAYYSQPGFTFAGKLWLKTKKTDKTGPQTFDLYLTGTRDPNGTARYKVARIRLTINFKPTRVLLDRNPHAENPPAQTETRTLNFVYKQAAGVFEFELPDSTKQVLSVQTVLTGSGQVTRGDRTDASSDWGGLAPPERDTTVTLGSVIEILDVQYPVVLPDRTVQNRTEWTERNSWVRTRTVGATPVSERIRIWEIVWDPTSPDKPAEGEPYLVLYRYPGEVAKPLFTVKPDNKKVLDIRQLQGFDLAFDAVLVVKVELAAGDQDKRYEGLPQIRWPWLGAVFDPDFRTQPSDVQAQLNFEDAISFVSRDPANWRRSQGLGNPLQSEDMAYRLLGYFYRAHSFCAVAQQQPLPADRDVCSPYYRDSDAKPLFTRQLLTDIFTGERKLPYINDALTAYVRSLAHRANAQLRNRGLHFRYNEDAWSWLVCLRDRGAAASALFHNIGFDPHLLVIGPDNDYSTTKLPPHVDGVVLHELGHISVNHIVYNVIKRQPLSSWPGSVSDPEAETQASWLAGIMVSWLYPEIVATYPGYSQEGQNLFPAKFYQEPFASLVFEVMATTEATHEATRLKLLAAGVPADYLKRIPPPDRRLDLQDLDPVTETWGFAPRLPDTLPAPGNQPGVSLARPQVTFVATRHFTRPTGRERMISHIVLHDTAAGEVRPPGSNRYYNEPRAVSGVISHFRNSRGKESAHYIITKTGLIIQMVPNDLIAHHAGRGNFDNWKGVNKSSIGIEISNRGSRATTMSGEGYTGPAPPADVAKLADKYERLRGLPDGSLLALMWTESEFHAGSQSNTGVGGIMQITREIFRYYRGREDLFWDVEEQIKVGSAYFADIRKRLRRRQGREPTLRSVAAAYNTGEGYDAYNRYDAYADANQGRRQYTTYKNVFSEGGVVTTGDPYTMQQYRSLALLVAWLMVRYRIPFAHVVGHSQVAHKSPHGEPGPSFSWRFFRKLVQDVLYGRPIPLEDTDTNLPNPPSDSGGVTFEARKTPMARVVTAVGSPASTVSAVHSYTVPDRVVPTTTTTTTEAPTTTTTTTTTQAPTTTTTTTTTQAPILPPIPIPEQAHDVKIPEEPAQEEADRDYAFATDDWPYDIKYSLSRRPSVTENDPDLHPPAGDSSDRLVYDDLDPMKYQFATNLWMMKGLADVRLVRTPDGVTFRDGTWDIGEDGHVTFVRGINGLLAPPGFQWP